MSYTPGVGSGLAACLDLTASPPHITCDRCGLIMDVNYRRGVPPVWLLDGKAPRGWRTIITPLPGFDGRERREDYCPRCKETQP